MTNIKLILSMMLTTFFYVKCWAAPFGIVRSNYTLDVYRSNQINAGTIDLKYGSELKQIADAMLNPKTMSSNENSLAMIKKMEFVMDGLQKSGQFSYIRLSPIVYPNNTRIGFTVDVVDKGDERRMQGFLPKPTQNLPDPKHLVQSWKDYEKYGFKVFFSTKRVMSSEHCPAFHCIFGFDDPAVKHYGVQFNRDVPIYKNELITILRQDKDESKRGAAAYLLAHLKNANEVADALTPSMRDSSSLVRNNVMRVFAEMATKVKLNNFPVDDAIRALSYPSETDRNKALFMLDSITAIPKYAAYVKRKGCQGVLNQYRLIQPNLHDTAYKVLMNMSGEHYPIDDYTAWEQWASQHCQQQINA